VDVKGDVVIADTMSCQKEIARKIQEKGADYILAVKENQPALYGDIKEYLPISGLDTLDLSGNPPDCRTSQLKSQ
jgi:predicted transposase YbfD/YdcC